MFGGYYRQPQGFAPYGGAYGQQLAQLQQVTRVSGIESARQIPLPPNSTMLALDYDDRHVYAVYSDGAGTVTAKPYTMEPCEAPGDAGGYVARKEFYEWREKVDEHLSKLESASRPGPAQD